MPSTSNRNRRASRQQAVEGNHQKRRKGMCLAALLFLVVVACAIAFPVLFVANNNNKKETSSAAFTGNETGVDVVVTFETVPSIIMDDAQMDALTTACLKFFTLNLAGLRLRGVFLITQQFVALRDDSSSQRRRRNLQSTAMGLETKLRVLPESANATLTSQQLASLVDQNGDELISILQQDDTADDYFDTIVTVYATVIEAPSAAPTVKEIGTDDDGTCNGLVNLCHIPVNEVLFATMHNANADKSVVLFVPNHNEDLMAGLNAGIRGLNMDLGFCLVNGENVLSLMHSTCAIGFSNAQTVLTNIHHWLSANPHQVILMPLQLENTGSPVLLREHVLPLFQSVVDDDTGKTMADRLYSHPGPGSPWPTLGELIAADERILFFFYNSEETCALTDCPAGFHDWFVYAAETEFVFESVEDIQQDPVNSCRITRGGSGTRDFFGINLFLEVPNEEAAATLNGDEFLESHFDECSQQTGLTPNLVIVDFWDQGNVIQVVNDFNAQLQSSDITMSFTNVPSKAPSSLSIVNGIPSLFPTPTPSSRLTPSVQQVAVTPPPTSSPTLVAAPASILPPDTATRTCNGLSNLCDMPVNEILFATMHNANADRSTTFLPNHDENLVAGLAAGIRGLSIDMGYCLVDEELRLSLVHGVCFVGISDPVDVFAGINDFLQQNPNEVIIMPVQIADDTGGTVQLNEIFNVMERVVDSSGVSMANRLYAHPGTTTAWPTLGELIDLDKRILFFVYNGEQTCESGCPVGFHDWFAYAMETKFEFDDVATIFNDPEDACVVTRGGSSSNGSFFGVNVFTRIASDKASVQLNDAAFLRQHLETCSVVNSGKNPNLILVDFWNIGDVIEVTQEYNENLGAN